MVLNTNIVGTFSRMKVRYLQEKHHHTCILCMQCLYLYIFQTFSGHYIKIKHTNVLDNISANCKQGYSD